MFDNAKELVAGRMSEFELPHLSCPHCFRMESPNNSSVWLRHAHCATRASCHASGLKQLCTCGTGHQQKANNGGRLEP